MTSRLRQLEFMERATRRASRSLLHAALLFVVAGACSTASAQGRREISIGGVVYAQSCANQNCHGDQGKAGKAPALAQRGFKRGYVMKVTRQGIPETAMPGWEKQLPVEDLEAVVSYVISLQGATAKEAKELDPDRD